MSFPMSFLRLLPLTLLVTFAWSGPRKPDGILHVGRAGDAITLDPAKVFDDQSHLVVHNIFQGLVQFSTQSMELRPCLAQSWRTNADHTRWTFKLRRDVTFHDGTPMNADAVVFSLMRQIDPNHPFHQTDFTYADTALRQVKSVEAVDPYTVVITLSHPFAPFLANLALAATYIVSPTAVKTYGPNFEHRPVGTGPFKFLEWRPNKQIIISRFDGYWEQPAQLDQVIFHVIHDPSHRLLEFQAQRLDWLVDVSLKFRDQLTKLPNTRLIQRQGHNVFYLAMNTRKKPFDNPLVRRAVNHAVNREKLIKLIFQSDQILADTPVPPGVPGHDTLIKGYEYNPDLAKKLLAQAGYPDGFEATLVFFSGTNVKGIDLMLKAALAAVGIRVRVRLTDWRTYTEATKHGEHDLCLDTWSGDNGDPDNFLYTLLSSEAANHESGFNLAFYQNPAVDKLLIEARGALDPKKRDKLYHKAQVIIHDDAPWLPICFPRSAMAVRDNVHGQVQLANGWIRFDKVWLE